MADGAQLRTEPCQFSLTWTTRSPPLEPKAVMAVGEVMITTLKERIFEVSPIPSLRGIYVPVHPEGPSNPIVILLGPTPELPWVDGVQYFGEDSDSPGLLWPTHSRPQLPVELVHQALISSHPKGQYIFYAPNYLIPLDEAQPIDLQSWPRIKTPGLRPKL